MKHLFPFIISLATVAPTLGEIKIDGDFPGGNVHVVSIDGDNVRLQRDIRDTEGDWFYWSFRIRGAEGRMLDFEFTGNWIGARGPAVSNDGGDTWRWHNDKPDFPNNKFQYTFKPDEKDVLFGMGMNYVEKDLIRFLEKYKDNPYLKMETLCKSKKERNVELLRIPGKGNDAPFKVFFAARHHCCEMMANYSLEGIIETILSDSDDGKWLREHCDFFIVPFVDKDGVEDGDQGKNRKPHDHNRDYIQKIYPEVRSITEQAPKWAGDKPVFWMDLHCPWLRGGADGENPEKGTNEYLYQVGFQEEECWEKQQRFGAVLESERKGPIPYKKSFDLPYGVSWNKTVNWTADSTGPPLQSCKQWGNTIPNVQLASSLEIPYANASGVAVDADSARALGHDLARAMRVYLDILKP